MYNYDWRVNKETGENGIVLLEGPYKDVIFTFKKSKVIDYGVIEHNSDGNREFKFTSSQPRTILQT